MIGTAVASPWWGLPSSSAWGCSGSGPPSPGASRYGGAAVSAPPQPPQPSPHAPHINAPLYRGLSLPHSSQPRHPRSPCAPPPAQPTPQPTPYSCGSCSGVAARDLRGDPVVREPVALGGHDADQHEELCGAACGLGADDGGAQVYRKLGVRRQRPVSLPRSPPARTSPGKGCHELAAATVSHAH